MCNIQFYSQSTSAISNLMTSGKWHYYYPCQVKYQDALETRLCDTCLYTSEIPKIHCFYIPRYGYFYAWTACLGENVLIYIAH